MVKRWSGSKNFYLYIPFLLFWFLSHLYYLLLKKLLVTIKAAKSANKVPRNPCFFISHLRSSNGSIIFTISWIYSFDVNKVNPFPALAPPSPLLFLSNSFIVLAVKLLTNPCKLPLAGGIVKFVKVKVFLNYLKQKTKRSVIELS